MTATLWGRVSSVNVQKVLWMLAELDLDYDRIDAGGPRWAVSGAETDGPERARRGEFVESASMI